jgi:MYXO-CTERM domain-containing protein
MKRVLLRLLAASLGLASAVQAPPAAANGRLPGATELTIAGSDAERLVIRATFGFVQSFDGGASWQWICENAIQVSGEADPPFAVTADATLVLLPPAGGALISRDQACSWSAAPAPLADRRTIDLTLDPANRSRVLVVTSTVAEIDAQGIVTYETLLVETRDDARSFTQLATLPSDFKAETLEIAPSDSARIYVSGTANDNPLVGVLLHSDDGGKSWSRHTLGLPDGSGSLFISGIHPTDSNRVWLRVPVLGDAFGRFPASLVFTPNHGESFRVLAVTNMGMFGFALSPDGSELAYGGPFDGLFVGASDGSAGFAKTNTTGVRCLRWNAAGLYACGTEPTDAFSVGLSTDHGASFSSVYRIAQTCPQACADASALQRVCREPWRTIAPVIGATESECSVQWLVRDAGSQQPADAADDAGSPRSSDDEGDGCSCAVPASRTASGPALTLAAAVLALLRRRRARPSTAVARP